MVPIAPLMVAWQGWKIKIIFLPAYCPVQDLLFFCFKNCAFVAPVVGSTLAGAVDADATGKRIGC